MRSKRLLVLTASSLLVLALGLTGCAGVQEGLGVLSTPQGQIDMDPNTPGIQAPAGDPDKTPGERIGSGVTGVATNPANFIAWQELIGGIAVTALAVYGNKKRKERKAKIQAEIDSSHV